MRWVLLFLLLSLLFALLGLWVLKDPGEIVITWLGYEVQTSLFFGLIFLIALYVLLFYLLRCLCYLWNMVSSGVSYLSKNDHKPDASEGIW
jgi:HemY protein